MGGTDESPTETCGMRPTLVALILFAAPIASAQLANFGIRYPAYAAARARRAALLFNSDDNTASPETGEADAQNTARSSGSTFES